jgi:hypothetical protein
MSVSAVSPLLLQRYELKYAIPLSMVDEISAYIEGWCNLDYFSQISPKNSYTINSLYFDTLNHQFLVRKANGAEIGHSLRVRSYGDNPKPPYYAEIKVKMNDFSNKMRAKLQGENWEEVIRHGVIPEGLDPVSEGYLKQFLYLIDSNGASPKILTQYKRKAYLSTIDNYARVTFDRDLRYMHCEDFCVTPDESKMIPYDLEDIYPHPDEHVILELKAEKRIPMWMIELIRRFDLSRVGFSKYGSAITETKGEPDFVFGDIQSWL